MTLSYDFTRVKDYGTVCLDEEGKMCNLTYALVISSQSVGMSEITYDNAAEFYARIKLIEKIHGLLLKDDYIKPTDIHAHINLKTNAPDQKFPKWAEVTLAGPLADKMMEYNQRALPIENDSTPGKGVIT